MPVDIITGSGDDYIAVADVNGPVSFTGPCWQFAPLQPNGDFMKVCGETGETEPCVATVALDNGETWKYTFACTEVIANQGFVQKAGGSTGTYLFHKWATKQRIAP